MTTATGDFVIDFKVVADTGSYTNSNLTFFPVGETVQIVSGLMNSNWTISPRLLFRDSFNTYNTGKTSRVEKNSPSTAGGECGAGLYDSSGNGYELKVYYDELRIFRVTAVTTRTPIGGQVNTAHAAGSVFGLTIDASGNLSGTLNGVDIGFGAVNDTTYPASTLTSGGYSDRDSSGGGYASGIFSFGAVGVTSSETVDTITSPIALGGTGSITTTGLGTLTSLTIGGKQVSSLSAPSGDGTFSIPLWVDGVQGFLLGSGQAVVAGDGTKTANSSTTLNPQTNYTLVTLTSVVTSNGYLGNQVSLSVGDQIIFPTAASVGVATNYIDVDGGIYTDYSGTQTLYKRNVTTGIVTQITLINGNVAPSKFALLWLFGM